MTRLRNYSELLHRNIQGASFFCIEKARRNPAPAGMKSSISVETGEWFARGEITLSILHFVDFWRVKDNNKWEIEEI